VTSPTGRGTTGPRHIDAGLRPGNAGSAPASAGAQSAIATAATRSVAAVLACVAAAFCWALAASIAKGAFERGVSPERVAESRALVALVPLLIVIVATRRDLLRPPRAAIAPLLVFGVSIAAVNFTYFLAIDRVPVGVAISLQYTAPALVLVGTALVARRAPAPAAWLAAALTLTGAVLVSGALGGLAGLDPIGIAAGVGAAATFASYLVSAAIAGRRGAHPATSLAIGFAVALVAWSTVLPWWDWPWHHLADPQVSLRLLAIGVVGTLIPFALAVWALRTLTAAVAGIAATTEPVFAAALAWLLLGQQLGPAQLLGGGLVVIGVVVAQLAQPAPATPTTAEARA
jgi:drug/metabolite transporter (DMT)-like permease